MNSKRFKLGNLNARSLMPHLNDIKDLILNHNFDVFCITETWLKADIPSNLLNIQDYNLLRKDRRDSGRRGGYIRS